MSRSVEQLPSHVKAVLIFAETIFRLRKTTLLHLGLLLRNGRVVSRDGRELDGLRGRQLRDPPFSVYGWDTDIS